MKVGDLPSNDSATESPLKLIYNKSFTEVNSITDTVAGLKDCKKIYFELITTKPEALTVSTFYISGLLLMYNAKMNSNSNYPVWPSVGEITKIGENYEIAKAWSCIANTTNQNPTGSPGMQGLTRYMNKEMTKYTDEVKLTFQNAATADVSLRIWGC